MLNACILSPRAKPKLPPEGIIASRHASAITGLDHAFYIEF